MFNLSLKFLLFISFISLQSYTSVALTGKEISNQVDQWLLKEGVVGKSIFAKNIIYKDCKNDLKIRRL